METIFKAITNLLPYHLLSYGTLLGTELYQVSLSRPQPPSPPSPQDGTTNQPTQPELHQHKTLLPNPPTPRIPPPPKTPLPNLLRLSGQSSCPHSRDTPAVRAHLAGGGYLGRGAVGCCGCYRVVELGMFWTQDGDGFVGSVGSEG